MEVIIRFKKRRVLKMIGFLVNFVVSVILFSVCMSIHERDMKQRKINAERMIKELEKLK